MAAKNKALVNPQVLAWARETAGFGPGEAAKKISVSVDKLLSSEAGSDHLTVNQLRIASRVYKRPLAVFYLSEPPREEVPLHDFRRLPGRSERTESPSPALRFEIRRALFRRGAALELFRESEGEPTRFDATAKLSESPESVAGRVRQILSLPLSQQGAFTDPYDAYNKWRASFEKAGVMVFQASISELDEMRGFSISETPLPVIVVNSKDSVYGRIFSMFHEMAHLMLREGGLCNFVEETPSIRDRSVEVFCNAVAGAALVPRDALLRAESVGNHRGEIWDDQVLVRLASEFSVSREVVVRRLLTNNLTSDAFYKTKREQFQKEFAAKPKAKGFASPAVKTVSNVGLLFVQLVLDGYSQERITSSDVSDLLGVRLKHISKIAKLWEIRVMNFLDFIRDRRWKF